MSDAGRNIDRRAFDAEFRERLTRVETWLETRFEDVRGEIVGLRKDRHDTIAQLQVVTSLQEEAREHRMGLSEKMDALTAKMEPMIVSSAQLAVTVATHLAACVEYKKETEARVERVDKEFRAAMMEIKKDQADQTKLQAGQVEDIIARVGKLELRSVIYLAVAFAIGILVSHGALVEKIVDAMVK